MKPLLALLALIAVVSAAQAFQLGQGDRFGRLGAMGKGTAVAPPACSNALDLSQACNSQYIGTL